MFATSRSKLPPATNFTKTAIGLPQLLIDTVDISYGYKTHAICRSSTMAAAITPTNRILLFFIIILIPEKP